MDDSREFFLWLKVWSALAVGCAALALGLGVYLYRSGQKLLPPQRQRAVPWRGGDVFVAAFLVLFFWPGLTLDALNGVGFFKWVYGPDSPAASTGGSDQDKKIGKAERDLWASNLAWPFSLGSTVWLLRRVTGAQLYQMGLTWSHGAGALALGVIVWILLTPIVFGTEWLTLWVYHNLGGHKEEQLLTEVMRATPLAVDRILVVVLALITAPLTEEFIFRGLLQPWVAKHSWGANAAMALAFALAFARWQIKDEGPGPWPALFAVAMLPGYFFVEFLTWRWLPVPHAARAIYGTALVFALSHLTWPDPIPLFLLGLGLGYVAYRTQSLVGSIFLHSTFNLISCLVLLS